MAACGFRHFKQTTVDPFIASRSRQPWLPLHKRQEFETLVFYFICRDISEKLLFTSAILVAPVFDNLYKGPTGLSFHFKTKVIKRDFFILKFNDTKNYITKFARVHFL